jgi:ferredoxin
MPIVKIVIDEERCTGHGRCYSLVPELFDSDDQGHSLLRDPGAEVSADQVRQAQVAVDNCPEDCISLQD